MEGQMQNKHLTWVKYASLLVLVVQNSALALLLRLSQMPGNDSTTHSSPKSHSVSSSATAVLSAEWMKMVIALLVLGWTLSASPLFLPERNKISRRSSLSPTIQQGIYLCHTIWMECFGPESRWQLCVVPAFLYFVQNNLQYRAASLLDPATFQVTYQLKLLTTAIFTTILLKRNISAGKWMCLVILTVGVALVQLPKTEDIGRVTQPGGSVSLFIKFQGLFVVLLACVLSGLAGVWFEKVLKNNAINSRPQSAAISLWVRTVQLCMASIVIGTFSLILFEFSSIRHNGFFYGYTRWTWYAIACQAFGGLVVALVVKYADNIMKGFATSLSIILSAAFSVWIFGTVLNKVFWFGALMVIGSALGYLYLDLGRGDGKRGPTFRRFWNRWSASDPPSPPLFMAGYVKELKK